MKIKYCVNISNNFIYIEIEINIKIKINIKMNNTRIIENINPSLVEGFDGIRKNNARQIFGILLIIIVVDFAMELLM